MRTYAFRVYAVDSPSFENALNQLPRFGKSINTNWQLDSWRIVQETPISGAKIVALFVTEGANNG